MNVIEEPDRPYTITLSFPSRTDEGDDIARTLTENLGPDANLQAVLSDEGTLTGYELHLPFSSPEAAFDAALAIRNFIAANGWPVDIS